VIVPLSIEAKTVQKTKTQQSRTLKLQKYVSKKPFRKKTKTKLTKKPQIRKSYLKKTPTIRKTQYSDKNNIAIQSIKFYYKPDGDLYYNEIKDNAVEKYKMPFKQQDLDSFYKKAYNKAFVVEELSKWNENANISPLIIDSAIIIINNEPQMVFNIKVKADIKYKIGKINVDTMSQTINYDYLSKTASWKNWKSYQFNIPALANGETKELKIEKLCLSEILKAHPNSWPKEISVNVKIFPENRPVKAGYQKIGSLKLVPDMFQAQKKLY